MAPPPRLADPDRAALAFAAEHRFVLSAQIARLLGVSTPAAARRLVRLRTRGLLVGVRPLRFEPTAFSLSRGGLDAVDGDLPVPRKLDLAEYRHDVGLAWLSVAAHRGAFGDLSEIVGERRMRSEDGRRERPPGTPTHGVRIASGVGDGPRLHYPDLVLRTAGGRRIAVELELTTKKPVDRERILRAYAGDQGVDGVLYLAPTPAAARAIEASAARVGASDLVRVQRFAWAGGREPTTEPAARERSRRRTRGAVER